MRRKISLWLLAILALSVPLWAQGYFEVSQGPLKERVEPLVGTQEAAAFYSYVQFPDFSSNCPLAEDDATVVFLYADTLGQYYLFVIHDVRGSATGGSAEIYIQGIPPMAAVAVADDPDSTDTYDLTTGRFTWVWNPGYTDGMVLGPLGENFELVIDPVSLTGIDRVVFLSGDITAPQRIELNTVDPIKILGSPNAPPVARFTISPAEPRIRQEVTFDASASHDPDGQIVEYRWDFDGDGVVDLVATEPVVKFTYEESALYEPSLTVVDDAGIASTYTGSLYVSPISLTATRSISTMTVLPGYTFRVTVRIHTEQDMAGVGLDEDLPVGWEVTPVENGGAIFKRATTQWVFMDMLRAGTDRVITYDVKVPEEDVLKAIRLPQRFCIQGTVQAKVPAVDVPVGGESCVIVNDCLPVLEAIAHLIPAQAPGETDRIDLRLPETITEQQLNRAAELWATDQPVVDTCGKTIDQATLKLIAAHAVSCTPVDKPLPEMPAANVTVTRTIIAPIPCQGVVLGFYDSAGNPIGNTFTVKIDVTTDADVIAVGIDEDLPVGWKVTPLQNGGFVYKPSKIQWTYLGLLRAGETRTIVYEVEVPPTLPIELPPPDGCGIHDVKQIVGVADIGLPCIEDLTIAGDDQVELTKCLNVIVAISRWDVERDTVDLSLSDLITLPQVQRAIAFWLEEEEVPYTCGATIDYETLKEIIALWLTDTPICEVLPSVIPEECQGR
jgi:PKD repeat protein